MNSSNNLWLVLLIVVLLIAGLVALVKLAPSVVSFHKDSLNPINNLFGNKENTAALAAML